MSTNEIVIVEESKPKHVCPIGTYNGLCVAVYDLGKQKSGKGWPDRRQLAFIFEVAEQIADGPLAGQPYRVSKIVSATLSDKSTLTALLTSWAGFDPRKHENGKTFFSPSKLVGKPCMLTVAHKTTSGGDAQAFISGISSPMKGLPVLKSTFDPANVPEWVKTMQSQRLDPIPQQEAASNTPEQQAAEVPPPPVDDIVSSQGDIPTWLDNNDLQGS
jgi:hypothetical protein